MLGEYDEDAQGDDDGDDSNGLLGVDEGDVLEEDDCDMLANAMR